MEERECGESRRDEEGLTVAVGLTGGRKSKYILRWALDYFLPEGNGNVTFKLLYVYSKITCVPTPNGIWLPIAQVRGDITAAYRQEVEWKKRKYLLPYQQILKARKIKTDIVMVESDNIAMAISLEIERRSIRHLVVGVSSTSFFSRKHLSIRKMLGENHNLSTVISEAAPVFCSVYTISDGKLQWMRPADAEQSTLITMEDISDLSTESTDSSRSSSSLTIGHMLKRRVSSPIYPKSQTFTEYHPINKSESTRLPRESSETMHHACSDTKADESVSFASQGSSSSGSWNSEGTSLGGFFGGTPPMTEFVSSPPTCSFASTPPTGSFVGTPPSQHQSPRGSSIGASPCQVSQIENLRTELRLVEHMHELAQNTVIDEKMMFPFNQLDDLSKQRLEEAIKLKEENELASTEKNKPKTTQIEAPSDLELHSPQKRAERKAACEAKEDESKTTQLVSASINQYQKFSWDDIVAATSSFSEEFKIGMGAFGTVYKCKLCHTTVAVKVLHCKNKATDKQFLQELEILSSIHHRHLLLLLGAVPDESCLVYEYMQNGSLEDRLFRKDNKPPLIWYDRFRICWEVASALAFLHNTKPNPIIHRDLKPANILLDQNLVSKIGDAGLGTMLSMEPESESMWTLYKETSPVGTLCYIDPEYQRTGRVSTKSDIYALGIVILQLLTAKPAVGIAYIIEDAIDEGNLIELLDLSAGEWPEEETFDLALLALQCAELRGRDRPDLREKVLPFLESLKEVVDRAKESASSSHTAMPAHFICPIMKDIMENPYVAADGYTYDRRAIEQWLTSNNMSPTTNLPLSHQFIMPNYTLLEAIKEWKENRPAK